MGIADAYRACHLYAVPVNELFCRFVYQTSVDIWYVPDKVY